MSLPNRIEPLTLTLSLSITTKLFPCVAPEKVKVPSSLTFNEMILPLVFSKIIYGSVVPVGCGTILMFFAIGVIQRVYLTL